MKRTISSQGLGLRSLFPVNSVSLYFANMRLAILSVSLISIVLIWPAGLSQARDVVTVKHSNPTASLKTIIVGDYYPYTFVNDKGVPDGFSVDVAKAVVSVMDLNLDIKVDTWEHATRALSDGTIDMLPMMAYSPERKKLFDFSAPHTIAYDAVFSRGGAQKIRSLKDLNDKTVIVMNKDAAHQYLLASGLASKMKLILVDSLPDALRTLAAGKGDVALMPKLVGLIIMNKLNLTNLDPSPVVIDAYNRPFSFAVKEGNQALLERLSQGLSIIKSTGRYKEIYNKWFGAMEPPGLSWKTVIQYISVIVVVFLFIAVGLILWTVSLRKQVSLRTKYLTDEIQERKRVAEELQSSAKDLRESQRIAHLGSWRLNVATNQVVWSEELYNMYGFDPALPPPPYTEHMKLFTQESWERLSTALANTRETGIPYVLELETVRKDGSNGWMWVRGETEFDSEGKTVGLWGAAQDITERKRVEEELRESETRFRTLSRVVPVGVYMTDEQGHCRYVNERWLEMAGITFEEALGDGWIKGIHPQDRDLIASSWHKMIESKGNWGLEYRFQTRDGIVTWVNGLATEFFNSTGQLMGYIGANMDITDRKKAEDALREGENRYRTVVSSVDDGIILQENTGMILTWNKAAERIFGISADEVLGQTSTSRDWKTYREDGSEVPGAEHPSMHTLATGEPCNNILMKVVRSTGDYSWINVNTSPIFKERDTKPRAVVISISDITDRKQAEEEKRNMEERLQRAEKMEALGTLAGGVAHDLNNVLGIVVGYSEMLLDEIGESNPLRGDVIKIMEGGHRSAAIVQDLLTLARRGVQTPKVFNLNDTINDCRKTPEFEKASSSNPKVKIKTDLDKDLLNIMGSPMHLGKTFLNLVVNAVEAMSGGGVLTIVTRNQSLDKPVHGYDAVNEGDYVVLSVTDTGEGISDHDIKRIFEPFYTKKVMGRSGTGLGLAVAWGTVKDHNGYIDVQSEVGKGTTFTLYFPVTREEMAVVSTAIPLSDYIGNDESILVIDDIKEQRELAAKMLGKLNYRVKTVSSGEEAVEYLRTEKADLIVLDMIMDPGMDGLDTYKAILAIHPKQKAIIVSGFSETDRVIEARSLGAGEYLRKPYVIERLGMAARKELDRK